MFPLDVFLRRIKIHSPDMASAFMGPVGQELPGMLLPRDCPCNLSTQFTTLLVLNARQHALGNIYTWSIPRKTPTRELALIQKIWFPDFGFQELFLRNTYIAYGGSSLISC